MPKRVKEIRIGQRVLEAIAISAISCCYIAAVMRLGVDSAILSTIVGAIVFIVTRKRYKR